jgi:hypothetical protein
MFDAFHWPEGASHRFAVTESFLGSLSADGHVLEYPPIRPQTTLPRSLLASRRRGARPRGQMCFRPQGS